MDKMNFGQKVDKNGQNGENGENGQMLSKWTK